MAKSSWHHPAKVGKERCLPFRDLVALITEKKL